MKLGLKNHGSVDEIGSLSECGGRSVGGLSEHCSKLESLVSAAIGAQSQLIVSVII